MLHLSEHERRMAKVRCPSWACLTSYPFLTICLPHSVWWGGGPCPLRFVSQSPLRADFQLGSASSRHWQKIEGQDEGGNQSIYSSCFASDSILSSNCPHSVASGSPYNSSFSQVTSSPGLWESCLFPLSSSLGLLWFLILLILGDLTVHFDFSCLLSPMETVPCIQVFTLNIHVFSVFLGQNHTNTNGQEWQMPQVIREKTNWEEVNEFYN